MLRPTIVSYSIDVTFDDSYCEDVAGIRVVRCYCQVFDADDDDNDSDFVGSQACPTANKKKKIEKKPDNQINFK